ncbi:MAG: hypothetical protein AB9921_11005 [Erysipelotrichaceae bacterium]
MRYSPCSNKGFILLRTLLFFTFCIQFYLCVSTIAISIRSENKMNDRLEEFSFFEAAVLSKIHRDIQSMDYADFELEMDEQRVTVTFDQQKARLEFSGTTEVTMVLALDDLEGCFEDYIEDSQ